MSTNPATLVAIGNDLVTSTVCVAVETVLITVYAMMVIKTITILLGIRRGHSPKKVPIVTLAVVVTMYLMCLTLWIIDLVILVAEIRITLVKDPDIDLDIKYGHALGFVTPRIAAIDVIYSYLTLLGDGVIVWRVYAFWALGNWQLVMVLPILLLLISVASSMMLTYCVARLGGNIVLGAFRDPAFCRNTQAISYAAPAATTAVATILIGIKARTYFRVSRQYGLGDTRLSKRSKAEGIVVLLLESGLAYFLFFLAQVITVIPSVKSALNADPNLRFATSVFSYQTSCIVGMYPTIIICLVHARRSVMDSSTLRSSEYHSSIRGRKTPIALGGFRSAPESSVPTSRDVESREEEVDLQVFKPRIADTGGVNLKSVSLT